MRYAAIIVKLFFMFPGGFFECKIWKTQQNRKRLIFRYDKKIPDYFSVAGAP